MTNDDGRKPEGAPERSPKAGAGAPSGVDGNGPKRFSVQRKMAIVARLLRGEPLELVARETNVSIARLSEWRERALAGAATALKERERDDHDDEIARLKSKVGEITMDNELLYAKIAVMEGKRPLAHRSANRFEALEPMRQGVHRCFRKIRSSIASLSTNGPRRSTPEPKAATGRVTSSFVSVHGQCSFSMSARPSQERNTGNIAKEYTKNIDTSSDEKEHFCISDADVIVLTDYAILRLPRI